MFACFLLPLATTPRDDSKEKKKRRCIGRRGSSIGTIKKSTNQKTQISLKNRYYPEAYSGWEEDRRRLWDEIPFNANEYYLHYLPPSVEAHGEWTKEEKEALMETVNVGAASEYECRSILPTTSGVSSLFTFPVEQVARWVLEREMMCSVGRCSMR